MACSVKDVRPKNGGRVKRAAVADTLRQRIVAAHYAPGEQLPGCETLAVELGASHVTVLRGIDLLREEGFLRTKRRNGVFVTQHPPHLYECAMLFGAEEGNASDEPYHRVLRSESRKANSLPGSWRVNVRHAGNPDRSGAAYRAFVRRVEQGSYAGLIFPHSAHHWIGTPLLDLPGIARVATTGQFVAPPGVSLVHIDKLAFLERALEQAAAAGCKRVAVLMPPRLFSTAPHEEEHDEVVRRIRHRGLHTEPCWVIQIAIHEHCALRRVTHLLLSAPAARRPDALIVLDDHMTESVTLGVCDTGLVPPRDLQLITYCNFPDRPEAHVPVTRLGFDCHELFRLMIDAIDTQRRTGRVTRTSIKPVFEEELVARRRKGETP